MVAFADDKTHFRVHRALNTASCRLMPVRLDSEETADISLANPVTNVSRSADNGSDADSPRDGTQFVPAEFRILMPEHSPRSDGLQDIVLKGVVIDEGKEMRSSALSASKVFGFDITTPKGVASVGGNVCFHVNLAGWQGRTHARSVTALCALAPPPRIQHGCRDEDPLLRHRRRLHTACG